MAFGTIVEVVNVDSSDAGDLTPLSGVDALVLDVDGVE